MSSITNSVYQLPQKISSYIRRLEILYRNSEPKILQGIICNCSVYIREAVDYDNWDGGVTGHGIVLFLNEDVLSKNIDFEFQKKIEERLLSDFRECASTLKGEFISWVSIELIDENDVEYQTALHPFFQPVINPDSLNIWKPGYVRLFISHRDKHKGQASELAKSLETYGISSFVAHDNIKPMEEWQHTIIKAMQSMEILLAFITDDFFESNWTNQEIGFAKGRGIPIVSLKLEKTGPKGFIDSSQAMVASMKDLSNIPNRLYTILCEKLGREERFRKAIVHAFISSSDYSDVKERFERLKTLSRLTEADVQQIIEGFSKNPILHTAYYLMNENNRLTTFLENRTGKKYIINSDRVIISEGISGDE